MREVHSPKPLHEPSAPSVWNVPAYLPYVKPTLSPEAVNAAESRLGVKLPGSYLEILRVQNGGILRGRWPGQASRKVNGIGPDAPSITDEHAWRRPRAEGAKHWAPKRADLLVPFDGDAQWGMCFDYRKAGPHADPSVTLVDCELECEEPIAGNFDAYLAGLVDETRASAVRLYGDLTVEGVARALSNQLKRPAPFVDDCSEGYPTWRVALPGDHEWAWVSPNCVPASYRREGKRLIVSEESALRLPEDPSCVVLVSCTPGSRALVTAALAALGFTSPAG